MQLASEVGGGFMARMLARLEAKKQWAAAHPALAAAWDEALEEDERRTRELELEAARIRADMDMPHLLGKLGVGMVHREALRNPHLLEQRPSLRAARRYVGQRKPYPLPVLFLAGPAASGKTQAAVWVLAAWCRQHAWNTRPSGADARLAIYTRAVDVAMVDRFSTEGRGWLEQLRTAPLVVLDDIGTECATGPGAAVLYDVVDERYRQGRRTVVTSNLRGEQLKAAYDERLLRRLRESSVALIETKGKPELFEGGKKSAWEMRP